MIYFGDNFSNTDYVVVNESNYIVENLSILMVIKSNEETKSI